VKFLWRSAPLLAFGVCSCSLGASASQKAEAGRISRAIDVLREAPNAQKGALFAQLQNASCELPDLCELKRLCVAGYAEHLRGLDQTAHAKALLADSGAEAATEAIAALGAAKTALSKAEPQIAQCADAQGAAHRKYKF
jgi:hypothetical protein